MQILDEISQIVKEIEENLSSVEIGDQTQVYGQAEEYTHESLMENLVFLLSDIKVLLENREKFLFISTHDQRQEIYDSLYGVRAYLSNPDNLFGYVDRLKNNLSAIRVYGANEKIDSVEETLSRVTKKQLELSKGVADLEKQLNQTTENKKQSSEILAGLKKQQESLSSQIEESVTKLNEADKQVDKANISSNTILSVQQSVEASSQIIKNFSSKIVQRETQLEDQKIKTDEYVKHLKEFKEGHETLLKDAETLIKEAKTGLGYKKAEGISASFKTQLDSRKSNWSLLWLLCAAVFVGVGIWLTRWFFEQNPTIDWATTIARMSLIVLPLVGAGFCANQYTKNKNLIEDYAYKTMLAQSIIGFSEQLKSDNEKDHSYQVYIQKTLDEIHQHPLSNHRKGSSGTSIQDIAEQVRKVVTQKPE